VASPYSAGDPPAHAYIVIGGRRWRTSDPAIPATYRQELVDELMAARRAVGAARHPADVRLARARVGDAKVALGERGHPWWLPPDASATTRRIEAAMRALLRSRRGRLIYPTDVARIVGGTKWRAMLPRVRTVADQLTQRGELDILSRGQVVRRGTRGGVLRYRLAGDTPEL
jgi:Protein of unknown function (DUF3253)